MRGKVSNRLDLEEVERVCRGGRRQQQDGRKEEDGIVDVHNEDGVGRERVEAAVKNC